MMSVVQHCLTKIAEEASEVAKIALKAQQFGLSEVQPGREESNAQRMYAELNDLLAMVNRLRSVSGGEFHFVPDEEAMDRKRSKVANYLDYSQRLGLVAAGGAPTLSADVRVTLEMFMSIYRCKGWEGDVAYQRAQAILDGEGKS
ncbi:hypothetical protein [Burkholderia sp. MSMB1072]|uniref:hypothetical protein n=1 Tax=Burkholderia sp. MSMB1072 TaxID=1637871 RepID=UPI000B18D318|nr:hypothetical protein [Burkholderia sp. MSMB1072]